MMSMLLHAIATVAKNVLTLRLLYNLNLNWVLNPSGSNNIYEVAYICASPVGKRSQVT